MDEQMRLMVEEGTLSEGAYKALLETLGKALKDGEKYETLFEVKYRHNIVSAMSINFTEDDETRGALLLGLLALGGLHLVKICGLQCG